MIKFGNIKSMSHPRTFVSIREIQWKKNKILTDAFVMYYIMLAKINWVLIFYFFMSYKTFICQIFINFIIENNLI